MATFRCLNWSASGLQDTKVPEKTQAIEQKPVQDFTAVLTLVTARSDIVRNDGGSTSMGAEQGKICLVYALQYISCVYSYICVTLAPIQFQAALYLTRKFVALML